MIVEGILGLAGGLVTKGLNIYENKQKLKEKQVEQAHELALLEKQFQYQKELKTMEAETEMYVSANSLQAESYNLNTGLDGASQWVKNINAFVRPGITMYLVVCASIATATIVGSVSFDLEAKTKVFYDFLGLAFMAVSWWFGARTMEGKK